MKNTETTITTEQTQAKPKVSNDAIADMLRHIVYSSFSIHCKVILEMLLAIEPVISRDDFNMDKDRQLIVSAIENASKKTILPDSECGLDATIRTVFKCIEELENYVNKRAVIEAAITQTTELQGKVKKLQYMGYAVEQIFKGLDKRTKELLHIFITFLSADGVVTLGYVDKLYDAVETEPELVRSRSELAALVEAYDLAKVIYESEQFSG
jgi:hypothetical protein